MMLNWLTKMHFSTEYLNIKFLKTKSLKNKVPQSNWKEDNVILTLSLSRWGRTPGTFVCRLYNYRKQVFYIPTADYFNFKYKSGIFIYITFLYIVNVFINSDAGSSLTQNKCFIFQLLHSLMSKINVEYLFIWDER